MGANERPPSGPVSSTRLAIAVTIVALSVGGIVAFYMWWLIT